MTKTKRILAISLSLIMCLAFALTLVACQKKCENGHTWVYDEDADKVTCSVCGRDVPQYSDEDYKKIYNATFGDFTTAYEAAKKETNVSKRFALMAVAEAKLLETNAFSFTSANGGNYAISRVVPHTATDVRWGSDQDRFHQVLVSKTLIKAEDRKTLIAGWEKFKINQHPDGTAAPAGGFTGADYSAWARAKMTSLGYELKDEYIMAYGTENKSWDVFATSEQTDSEVLVNTYDGLVEYDELTLVQPALAESWTVSADGKTYTFKLREGLVWTNQQGEKVADLKASDFVSGLQHALDAQAGLEYLVDGLIVGASEYMAKSSTDFGTVGVKADDAARTVTYTLTEAHDYFITMLGYSIFAPLCTSFFTSHGGEFGIDAFAAAAAKETYTYAKDQSNIAYCGPYVVKEYTSESSMTLEANPLYWNKDNINIKKLIRKYDSGEVPTRLYDMAKEGTMDGAGISSTTLPTSKTDKLTGDAKSIFETYVYVGGVDSTAFMVAYNLSRSAYINWNDHTAMASTQNDSQMERAHAALNNRNFRQAMSFAFDRVAFRTARTGSAEIAPNALVNMYTPGDFVSLAEATTIKINGTDKSFPAGTMYGEIVQAQLTADNAGITVWKQVDGEWKSNGFDGWYNADLAKEKLKAAIAELKEQGVEVSKENPIVIDVPDGAFNAPFAAQGQSYKQSIETNLEGCVIINLVAASKQAEISYATYFVNFGKDINYDLSTGWTGWGPDFGDPCTFLDTFLPDGAGYMTKLCGLW